MTTVGSFERLTRRLSAVSVQRRWEAHRDVAWDDSAMQIDHHDPRWELPVWDPVGASPWYRDQAPPDRAAIGLHRAAAFMRVGVEFEAILKQGLLAFASALPNGHPAFRYAYHEISEEAQHSMMFQEFVDRTGLDVSGFPGAARLANATVVEVARTLPVLFFLCVLSGEEPIDHFQRRTLRNADGLHPLVRRINVIHCREEARHLSFARSYLQEVAPAMTRRDLRRVQYQAPMVVTRLTRRMFTVSPCLADRWGMPADVRAAIDAGAEIVELTEASTRGIATLCRQLGLVPAHLEKLWGAPPEEI